MGMADHAVRASAMVAALVTGEDGDTHGSVSAMTPDTVVVITTGGSAGARRTARHPPG